MGKMKSLLEEVECCGECGADLVPNEDGDGVECANENCMTHIYKMEGIDSHDA